MLGNTLVVEHNLVCKMWRVSSSGLATASASMGAQTSTWGREKKLIWLVVDVFIQRNNEASYVEIL